jgi:hypothetical protein
MAKAELLRAGDPYHQGFDIETSDAEDYTTKVCRPEVDEEIRQTKEVDPSVGTTGTGFLVGSSTVLLS